MVASRGEYQVFLSFRGSDTRYGFTDFLYHGLVDAGVHVFRDSEELRAGEVIGGELLRAIDNSIIYIPIFSSAYASSKWCLRELVHIVNSMSKSERKKSILPVFFHVEPESVKLKTPLYSNALLEHAEKFPEEVQAWKKALAEVGHIKGWNLKKDQSQAEIVKLVVRKILEKLEIKQKSVTEHLVGLVDQEKDFEELLNVNNPDVRFIGIYGMGGIRKTTFAKYIFNKLSSHFGRCCSFLEDVRESLLTKDGMVQLQKKLLSDIVGFGFEVNDKEKGMQRLRETLCTNKVLVVLDDVDNKELIKNLTGNYSLHSGSRIIITTRDTTILQIDGFKCENLRYEMPKMENNLALQLFCRHAFSTDFPCDDYRGLSREIVSLMGGLPLAIEVVGSLLKGKNEAFWKETLARLKKVPEKEIQEKLRISYDGLDQYQQQIFLDIACFFSNENKTDAICLWSDCELYPERGIDVLTSRCLIKILDNDKLWMHDQLIELGRQLVRQESPSDIGKRSRLWIAKEALEIVRAKEKKDKVEALEIGGLNDSIEITNERLERLQNLRFLKLRNGTYVGDFAKCYSKLRWISWHSPHKDFKAENMYLGHLLVFKLDNSGFTDNSKAWDLIKRAQNLKVLSLTWCYSITTIPDLSKCLELEKLTLAHCYRLKKIGSFIGDLQFLMELKIENCRDLTNLPEKVGLPAKLKRFSLRGCSKLRKLPNSLGNLNSLVELDLSHTGIPKLPNSIEKLISLRILRFSKDGLPSQERHVWHLPSGIGGLQNLEELDLSGHDKMEGEIPIEMGEISSLRILNLEGTHICGIPRTINMLHHLQTLNLRGCHVIKVLPKLPTSLTCLLIESKSLLSVPHLSNLTNLVELLLSDGSRSTGKSNLITGCNLSWIKGLSSLKRLDLNLLNFPTPSELASLSDLEELTLSYLAMETTEKLPSSLVSLIIKFFSIRRAELLPSCLTLSNLSTLEFCSSEVKNIPLDGVPQLENLIVHNCKLLQRLFVPLELRKLRQVCVASCPKLAVIEVVGLSKSLEFLSILQCKSLRRIGGLNELESLKYLKVRECMAELLPSCLTLSNLSTLEFCSSEVKNIPLDGVPQLENLIVHDCKLLQRLFVPLELRKLRQVCVASCLELAIIEVVGLSKSLEFLSILQCESLRRIGGLNELESLKYLKVRECMAELLPSCLTLSNLLTLEFCSSEVKNIPLDGVPQLENLIVHDCKLLQRLFVPLELRKLRQVCVASCPELAVIEVVGLSKSLEFLSILRCESLRRIGGLNELESLKYLKVRECMSLESLIDASYTNIADDCHIDIWECGDFVNDFAESCQFGYSWKHYKEPPGTTVTLKFSGRGLHSKRCIRKIRKIITQTKGVLEVAIDRHLDTATVKGVMDAKAMAENLRDKMKREVEIVPPEKKKEGGEATDKEGSGEDTKGGDCHKVAEMRMAPPPFPYGYYPPPPPPIYFHPRHYSAEEDPSSCSVM